MKFLRFLALIFIDAVGITHPSIEERDRAALYIASLLGAVILFLCMLFFPALHFLHI